MTAAEIMVPTHPLHASLVAFCDGKPVTKRQARKFLQGVGRLYKAVKAA